MKAKKKAVQQFTLGDLGIDAAGAKSELLKLEPVPERSGAKILEGSTRDQVVELVRILREEEKVL
jgi:electron transfer flavoprotein beta subunit